MVNNDWSTISSVGAGNGNKGEQSTVMGEFWEIGDAHTLSAPTMRVVFWVLVVKRRVGCRQVSVSWEQRVGTKGEQRGNKGGEQRGQEHILGILGRGNKALSWGIFENW